MAIALATIFAFGWIPIFAFRAESLQDALPYYSAAERRWVMLTPAILASHATVAAVAVSFTAPLPFWRAALGLAVFATGIGFWFSARRQIGPLRRTRLPDQPPARLRRDGAFGVVRNPLYFAYLVATAGSVIVAARPMLVVTWLACLVALAIRSEQEETRLHAQLGSEYGDYCREVKRLIPYVW